ncbi:hypothetical protein GE21DRAFT_1104234 [Neurospora crassa]|nr:hypothetical protein GE21DRAFT_1104234 [Neurospora crassa]
MEEKKRETVHGIKVWHSTPFFFIIFIFFITIFLQPGCWQRDFAFGFWLLFQRSSRQGNSMGLKWAVSAFAF